MTQTECTFIKHENDIKRSCAVDTLEGKDAIQMDIDRFEKWAYVEAS